MIEKHASNPRAIPPVESLGPSMGFLMSWTPTSSTGRVKEQVGGCLLMREAVLSAALSLEGPGNQPPAASRGVWGLSAPSSLSVSM